MRYALGVTAPCGALQFDLKYHISPKIVLRDALKTKASHLLIAYIGAAAWGRWYNEHIDLRAMREFNPDGWTAHCARMAEMLELNPSVRGIVGVGWFYDPAVAENSPGLAYIRETQMRYGGLLVRIGTEPHHIENAIFRSAVRRRLYEEGRLKVDPSVGFGGSEPLPKSRPVIPARPSNDRQAPAVAR